MRRVDQHVGALIDLRGDAFLHGRKIARGADGFLAHRGPFYTTHRSASGSTRTDSDCAGPTRSPSSHTSRPVTSTCTAETRRSLMWGWGTCVPVGSRERALSRSPNDIVTSNVSSTPSLGC